MNIFTIIFITIYITTLISYFFSETSGNHKRRAINKIILASMFLVFGIVAFFINYNFFSSDMILLFAIIVAFLGDVILLYSFSKGGITFIVSNLLFFSYEWILIFKNNIPFSKIWWFIILFVLLWGTFFTLNRLKVLNFKNKTVPILMYVFSVTLHGTLAIPLVVYFANVKMSLFGIGLSLFMVSDYFLMTHKFKCHKNWILRCNSGTYFTGLLLVVLSLIY